MPIPLLLPLTTLTRFAYATNKSLDDLKALKSSEEKAQGTVNSQVRCGLKDRA